jgi:nitronate monooxygenase
MITFYRGMKALEQAAFSHSYKTVWCAGPSIEHVKEILPVKELIQNLMDEYQQIASSTPDIVK